jgi:uncharacterized protein (DUF302 family)
MAYFMSKTVGYTFDDAIARTVEALKQQGFGVLTEIDVRATLKKKLDVDFRNYRILGACNPPLAHQALLAEAHIGIMMPCNVVVQEAPGGQVEVAAVDPIASMQATGNPALAAYAQQVRSKLETVLANI